MKTLRELGVKFYSLKEWNEKEQNRVLAMSPGERLAVTLQTLHEAKKLSPKSR